MVAPSPLDLLWIIVAAALVMLMQAGFLCLETGMTRSKNAINVAMKNVADFVVAVLVFWAVGFGLMFGRSAAGLIGTSHFLVPADAGGYLLAFFIFQTVFCSTSVTIISGAVAERMGFTAYLFTSAMMAGLTYPLFGHWAWGGSETGHFTGWLGQAGFVDWAGSSAVHSVGGWFSLALLVLLGPRLGRFDANGRPRDIVPSSLPLVSLGVLILWFGWLGFNGGSTLKFDERVPLIILNTTLGAAAGGAAGLALGRMASGTMRVEGLLNGIVAGMVAVTASAHATTSEAALLIGAVGALAMTGLEALLLRLRIDDAVGAVPVHLGAGVWGTLAVGLFGDPAALGTGLSRLGQIGAQLQGIAACFVAAFIVPLALLWVFARFFPLRVSAEAETAGLNVSEHGARTELHDFFEVIERQAETADLSLRVPEEPFTEVGRIARRYNALIDRVEEAVARTQTIVTAATDAILILDQDGRHVLYANPQAETLFGQPAGDLTGGRIGELMPALLMTGPVPCIAREMLARRLDGGLVPVELSLVEVQTRRHVYWLATLHDITARREAAAALRSSEERFRTMFENAALGLVLLRPDGTIVEVNVAFSTILDRPAASLVGQRLGDLIRPGDRMGVADAMAIAQGNQGETAPPVEARAQTAAGQTTWVRLAFAAAEMRLGDGAVLIAIVEDISAAKRAEEALRLAASVFQGTGEAIAIFNDLGGVADTNDAFARLFGYSAREARGLDLRHLLSTRHDAELRQSIEAAIDRQGAWQGEVMALTKARNLVPVWLSIAVVRDESGRVAHRFAMFTDLSERKEHEEKIWRYANFDHVTNLPNRRLLQDRLGQVIDAARRSGAKVGLCFLDLDKFKLINDTLGHHVGDQVLRVAATRLAEQVRPSDTVARYGGDEFCVIMPSVTDAEAVAAVAERLRQAIIQPFELAGQQLDVGASVGIALFPDDGRDMDALVRSADAAMYHAKENGGGVRYFTDDLNDRLTRRLTFERDLRRALAEDELFVLYQPQVDLASGRMIGAEALVRWRLPDGSLRRPDDFIPAAEQTGMIVALGQHVVRQVAADLAAWQTCLPDRFRIAVNVSPRQFAPNAELVETLRQIFGAARVPLSRLTVEITETGLMADDGRAAALLDELIAEGIDIALDDFGKGYSSLLRLRQLPIGSIKIDRDFVAGLPGDASDCAVVSAMVNMAAALGVGIVAEGIETAAQRDYLLAVGCGKGQGYLMGRPMPAGDLAGLLEGARSPA
ncbi:MAG: ammonium transporter [Alphaproteobacteria bacterium]|nr:ammonium transporter [Alphaproteobacteria bacterium]